jgi:ABC-type transport system substrate-binding protein/signal transduction histidine kinase
MHSRSALRVALFSVDPPGLTLFRYFDPDSFFVIPAINDALVMIDADGEVRPALATSWHPLSPIEWEFQLREGVTFHNGEPFDADSVVATFDAHCAPTPSAAYTGILGPLKRVTKLAPYRVRVETHFPDVMLIRRLFFMSIYPRGVLQRAGRDALDVEPIGTGAYRFVRYDRGREIVLERNVGHWANAATVDVIRLPILRQKEWVQRLGRGELDVAWNLDSHDVIRAQRLPGIHGASIPAAIAQLFLLSNRGPLADVRVRRALNHAVHRRILVDVAEHGLGDAQYGVAPRVAEGWAELEPYRYSPELARHLLEEAGYGAGLSLRGMVSETSTALFFAVREFLARVGVELDAEIVPRSVWMHTIVRANLTGGRYEGDFAVTSCDNPLLHSLFFQFVFFSSHGTGSLTRSADLDRELETAATTIGDPTLALRRLERHNRDEALMLFTVEQRAHAAWRDGVRVTLPRSGHFDAAAFWGLSLVDCADVRGASLHPTPRSDSSDIQTLLEATSHTGTFYLRQEADLKHPTVRGIWSNLVESERRWHVQNEPLLRQVVTLVEARNNLATVLESTDRVAIVGYSLEGRLLFANRGFELMFGAGAMHGPGDFFGADGGKAWTEIRATVERDSAWLGPVYVTPPERPRDAPMKLFLTVTAARDADGVVVGHTFVFSDFSGAEERIRTSATRTILEKVPYGLFVVDTKGRMKSGYSDACLRIFPGAGATDLVGRPLPSLLDLDPRSALTFSLCYEQVIEDLLPPDVALAQLPQRVRVGEKIYRLDGSVLRDETGLIEGVLFTMLDISAQTKAELEAERHKATITVLQFRDAFESFAIDLGASLSRLMAEEPSPKGQDEVRALLHTAKGVFGQFGLHELAAHVHAMEDHKIIEAQALRTLHARFDAEIEDHAALWRIHLSRAEPEYSTSETFLRSLEADIDHATSLEALRKALRAKLRAVREKTVLELVGPLAESARQLAARRGKAPLLVELSGGELRVPGGLERVFTTLVHVVRNAVEHGIEDAGERGGKPERASLTIRVASGEGRLQIVVRDDGRGIDVAEICRRATELGVVRPDALAAMSDKEKLGLVFVNGLSTAATVSDTAGRGVGAAATKEAVDAAGGAMDIESVPGEGTTLTIALPLGDSDAALA